MTTYAGRLGASETTLADGKPIILGEPFELTDEQAKDPHNKRLIDEGHIVEQKKRQPKKQTPNSGGDGS